MTGGRGPSIYPIVEPIRQHDEVVVRRSGDSREALHKDGGLRAALPC